MKEPNPKQQELIFKLQMFEQHMSSMQQQIQSVEQGVLEMEHLKDSVEELKGKIGEEILAQIGKGIFVKAKLISEDLIVDIGNKNLISKNIRGTCDLISEQIEKLKLAKEELSKNSEKIGLEMDKLMREFQKTIESSCVENCECEKKCDENFSCEKD